MRPDIQSETTKMPETLSGPKVSIMMPTYNHARFILRAIKSAQAQTYQNIEILIADDCSTDEAQSVVRDYINLSGDRRIKYFRNAENIGILRNYKRGLNEHATGNWVIN